MWPSSLIWASACGESLSDDSRAEELQSWIATWCGHLVQDPSGCAFISLQICS